LVVTLDDATSAVYSGFPVAEEGTASSFRALAEVIAKHGLFCEFYTDRGSHYFHTPKAGEAVSKTVQTQVGRALAQLGIRHIAAYSPEARGRSERAFRTLQDRLPKELALAGITTIAAANRWLAETYWPAHNAAFAVAPAETGSAFVADRTGRVRDILCIQEERRVGNDNTLKWHGLSLQIPPNPLRPHFCARHGAGARIPRWTPSDLSRAASASRLRPPRKPVRRHQTGCVSRFGSRPVDLWTTLRVAHNPTGPTTTEAVN
jgi:hypothetical protein